LSFFINFSIFYPFKNIVFSYDNLNIQNISQAKEENLRLKVVDKNLLEQKIKQGKEYLLMIIDKETGGVPKYYWPEKDLKEDKLRTTYTSTTLYSLLKIYNNFDKDEKIIENIPKITEFIFSMQNNDKNSRAYGGFHYSFDKKTGQKDYKFVAGTNSKTIYTLLDLYKITGDKKYLNSAERAADFLLTLQEKDGKISSYIIDKNNKYYKNKKFSFLYNGQTLSALSRVYKIDNKEKYYLSAKKIADNFIKTIQEKGCYLGDDYRSPNPISSSWVVMSLIDFYKINPEKKYKDIIFKCSDELLLKQYQNKNNLLSYGSWENSSSTSGTGWIGEVMSEVYNFCKKEKGSDCEKYKDSVIKASRWIIERTYSKEDAQKLNNYKIIGGIFWDYKEEYIRTDSVAHALNGYVNIFKDLKDGILLSL